MDDPYELAAVMFVLALCGLLLVAGELFLGTRGDPPPREHLSPLPGVASSVPKGDFHQVKANAGIDIYEGKQAHGLSQFRPALGHPWSSRR